MTSLSFFIIALDQATKRIATYYFERNILVSYMGFSNVLTCNKGVSFSFLSSNKFAFLLKYLMILFITIIIYLLQKSNNKIERVSLNLMLGGGISNLIDRFFFNGVIDFIHFDPICITPIVFNLADLSLTLGTIFLVINTLIDYETDTSSNRKQE